MCIRDRPIIDEETYDDVQRIRAGVRRYPDGWGEAHPLGGLLYLSLIHILFMGFLLNISPAEKPYLK